MTAPRLGLGALRRLHEAATPGPWGNKRQGVISDNEGELIATLGYKARATDNEEDSNAALIAAMRNALPALLSIAEAAYEYNELRQEMSHYANFGTEEEVESCASDIVDADNAMCAALAAARKEETA